MTPSSVVLLLNISVTAGKFGTIVIAHRKTVRRLGAPSTEVTMTDSPIQYRLIRKESIQVLVGRNYHPHGTLLTPRYIRTRKLAKTPIARRTKEMGSGIILANTYHLCPESSCKFIGGLVPVHELLGQQWRLPGLFISGYPHH